MKVLYLIATGNLGGIERHVQTLAITLSGDVEALICVLRKEGPATEAMRKAGLNVVTLDGRSGHDLKILPKFHKIVKEFKPDIVHEHETSILISLYLKFFTKVPLLSSIHLPSACFGRFGNRLIYTIGKRPNYYLPVSKATWDDFKEIYPKAKGEVLYNPLSVSELPEKKRNYLRDELGVSEETPIVGMVGRMVYQKNWEIFLQVSCKLLSQRPELHMVAVGDGAGRLKYQREWSRISSDKADIKDRLHWLGNREDAKELIGSMDLFLMVSHHKELPTTLLEAFAMKTPVAGFLPRGGTKEVLALSDNMSAWLIDEQNVDKVVENVEAVLRDKKLADKMVCTGREILVNHFDAEKICREQLLPIYNQLTAKNKSAS